MWHYIKEHIRPFIVGAAGSGVVWGNILFADVGPSIYPVLAYVLRLCGAVLIAFCSGVATIAATDFYKDLKSRIKKYRDGKRTKQTRQDDQQDAA